jgi:hypothetical protein
VIAATARAALVTGATLASALIVVSKASAANWDFNPFIEAGGTYNDNYRMAEHGSPKTEAYGSLIEAEFAMRLLDPRADISIIPHIRSTFLPDDHQDQSTDGFLDFTGSYRTQKATFGGTASYRNETVLSSELLSADFPGVSLGQVVGVQSGRVTVRNRRNLERLAPTMTYDLTPRRHLHLDAEYTNVSYSQNVVQQVGFRNFYGAAGLQFDHTQRSNFTVRGIYSHFQPDGSPNSTNRFGAEGEWDAKPTTTMQTYARVGVNVVRAQTTVEGIVSSTSVVGGAGASWTYQLSQYVLDGMRDLSPSASGAVVKHDELRFRMIRAWRPLLSSVIGARLVRVRGATQTQLGIQGSDYAAGSVALTYQITRNYRVQGEYDYTWQKFQGEPYAAGNSIGVSFIYQPLSRFQPLPLLNGIPTDKPK